MVRFVPSMIGWFALLSAAGLVFTACGGSDNKGNPGTGGTPDAGALDDAVAVTANDGASVDRARGQCDPMDVMSGDPQCASPGFNRFAWYGGSCAPFTCATCAGADCSKLYITAAGCDDAHIACYAVGGATRNCTADADCMVVPRVCCACGTLGTDDLIGVRTSEATAFNMSVCKGVGGCTACVSTIDPAVRAACVSARCQAVR
jgi:hypothetical protein